MMTYFEIRGRLETLERFRKLYCEYTDFTNRESNLAAQALLRKMEPFAMITVDSLNQVGLGTLVTREAQARGGRRVKINLIRAIFRLRVRERFNINDRMALDLLDRGIIRYHERLWKARLQLFNPLFWIFQISALLTDLPLLIARRAGYETASVEKAGFVKFCRMAMQFVLLIAAAAALLQSTGIVTLIPFDITHP